MTARKTRKRWKRRAGFRRKKKNVENELLMLSLTVDRIWRHGRRKWGQQQQQQQRRGTVSMTPVMKINAFQYDTIRHLRLVPCDTKLSLRHTDDGEVSETSTGITSMGREERFYTRRGEDKPNYKKIARELYHTEYACNYTLQASIYNFIAETSLKKRLTQSSRKCIMNICYI